MQYLHLKKLAEYPELHLLYSIKPSIKSLFVRGKYHHRLFEACAAVVGSRRMTHYGRQVIDKLVPRLVYQGKTIVSGFMYGVDQYAHRVCIDAGGKTIAVLGWGIENPLDPTDDQLAKDILASGGLIISEWQQQIGSLWTFPVRNRIVAGLAEEVYVIEAAIKSGSLLTADLATRLAKKVYAVPGPITSKTSAGTNHLIQTGKADMWLDSRFEPVNHSHDPILTLLGDEPLSTDEIARKLCQPIAQIGAHLSSLELTNHIYHQEGKYHLTLCSSN